MTEEIVSDLFHGPAMWAWLGPALMLVVAFLASLLIAHNTRRNISSISKAARDALARAGHLGHAPAAALPPFVTEGTAALAISSKDFILRLQRRVVASPTQTAQEGARASLDGLIDAMINAGFDPDDMQDDTVESHGSSELHAMAGLSIRLKCDERIKEIHQIALSQGFREDSDRGREAFSLADGHQLAGRRALERAMSNMSLLKAELGIEADFALVNAELLLESPGDVDGAIRMRARATWQRKPDQGPMPENA